MQPFPRPSVDKLGSELVCVCICDCLFSLAAQQNYWQPVHGITEFLSAPMVRRISSLMGQKNKRRGCANVGKSTGSFWKRSVWSGCMYR